MDLRNFANTNIPKEEATQEKTVGGLSERDVRRAINYFSGMNNDQLMRELSKHLNRKRAEGKEHEVHAMVKQIMPMLSEEQRARMEDIMKRI